jgi:hypothetical protein
MHGFHVIVWISQAPSYLTPKFYTCQPFDSLRVLPLSHFLNRWEFPCISPFPPQICLYSTQRFPEYPFPWLTFLPLFLALHLRWLLLGMLPFVLQKQSILAWPLARSRTWSPVSLKFWEPVLLSVHFVELTLSYGKRYDSVCQFVHSLSTSVMDTGLIESRNYMTLPYTMVIKSNILYIYIYIFYFFCSAIKKMIFLKFQFWTDLSVLLSVYFFCIYKFTALCS